MNMISQGQVAASQRKLFEGFVAGVAVAAIAIALAWGAFAALNAPKSVAPSTAPYITRALGPTRTSPTSVAVGAT